MVRGLLLHDRAIVLTALCAVVAMAWGWLLLGAGQGHAMAMAPVWTPGYAALMFVMWAGMMLAMMLPAATPAILLVATLMRQRASKRTLGVTGLFVLGYVLVWTAFSACATVAQWGLGSIGLLSARMSSNSSTLTGLLLIAVGLYQWTRVKQSCLTRCRSPVESLTRYWCHGVVGPLLSGAWHGAYCLGCCGMLMLLLFVGGVMNLAWIALLAILVLIEKTVPFAALVSRLSGTVLVAAGMLALLA